MNLLRKSAAYVAVLAGGVALWGAYAPRHEALNAIIALAPLLVIARLCSPLKSACCGLLFGLAYWLPVLGWMLALSDNNGPWPAVLAGWIGLVLFCAAFAALFACLAARLWQRAAAHGGLVRTACLFGEAILWCGCEWLRANLFGGFSWNALGTAFSEMPYFIAPAKFGGVYLVSALVVLFNGVAATLLLRAFGRNVRGPRWVRTAETALPLAVILLVLWAGKTVRAPSAEVTPLRVALVQRNAPCTAKAGPRENPYAAYGRLVDIAAAAKPDVLVLAESALCEFGEVRSAGARAAATAFLTRTGARALVAGGDERLDAPGAGRRIYNVAALYEQAGTGTVSGVRLAATYRKQHLVPFGEFIPLDKTFTVLQKLSPVGVSLWPGEPGLLTLPTATGRIRAGALVCFEDTDSALARRAAKDGAQVLLLVTNDAWFTPDEGSPVDFVRAIETRQHAQQTVLRAVETGLPILRAGNSGVTGVAFPNGRTRWLADGNGCPLTDAPGVLTETVPLAVSPVLTPYVRFGDIPLLLLFACALVGCFVTVRSRVPRDRPLRPGMVTPPPRYGHASRVTAPTLTADS